MRSRTTPELRGRCPRCWLVSAWCLCDTLPSVDNRTHILILRHTKERWKTTNTARIAALALRRCTIVEYGCEGQPFDPALLAGPETWVLFPDSAPPRAAPTARTLVVLDGTWGQARQMSHRVPGLSALPRLSLPPPVRAPQRLRQPPHPDGMATLEAIAAALAWLEGPETAAPLDALFDRHVRGALGARGVGQSG